MSEKLLVSMKSASFQKNIGLKTTMMWVEVKQIKNLPQKNDNSFITTNNLFSKKIFSNEKIFMKDLELLNKTNFKFIFTKSLLQTRNKQFVN